MLEDLEKSTESTEPNEEGSNELKPGSNETYDDGYGAYGGWKPEGQRCKKLEILEIYLFYLF